jgi:anti-sigma B factor antagonist
MNTTPATPQDAPEPNPIPPLIFEIRTTPGNEASERWTVVTVRGDVDMDTASQLVDAIKAVAGTAVVDLNAVTFLDSIGIRGLVQAQEALRERGEELILRDLSPSVRRVLELAGMTNVFTVEGAGPTRSE